jgi:hypothetical protein
MNVGGGLLENCYNVKSSFEVTAIMFVLFAGVENIFR